MPASKIGKNCTFAFLIGGTICVIGQIISNCYKGMGLSEELAGSATSVTLVLAGVVLTGLNIYPKIAKYAGAGTIVPITGFANSVSSPAIEAKTEGMVMGVGTKIFSIAGPVIVYGVTASVFAGIWFFIKSLL
ncbi:MAG: SpoVA/SpoVAEb family sporulation membrane protein [Ruminococcaceae bacterium]|nr:SpoVA/SpoVAEb family sporulation membrane protein [Oscillospiraceae bacterium]